MLATQTLPAARWNLSITSETDAQLRSYLGALGMKKGDLSRFVEEAVRWRMLDHTTEQVRLRNAEVSDDTLQALIDQALSDTRAAS